MAEGEVGFHDFDSGVLGRRQDSDGKSVEKAAACTNPQNSQSMNAPNATRNDSIEADLDICLMARRFKDGYVETATTASAHPITEENRYKILQTGN